jgi:hypothetical protein
MDSTAADLQIYSANCANGRFESSAVESEKKKKVREWTCDTAPIQSKFREPQQGCGCVAWT